VLRLSFNSAALGFRNCLPIVVMQITQLELGKPLIPARRRYDSVSGFPFPGTGPMFDLQIRLGNAQRIEAFLAELSAEGHWAAPDNGAIVRAAALLAAPRATELLVRIVRRNTTTHLSACDDLLLRCVAAPTGATGDLGQIGAALIEA